MRAFVSGCRKLQGTRSREFERELYCERRMVTPISCIQSVTCETTSTKIRQGHLAFGGFLHEINEEENTRRKRRSQALSNEADKLLICIPIIYLTRTQLHTTSQAQSPFRKHSSSHHPHHHQKLPSQPNTPAQVHYADLPAVSFERKPSTSSVLQKRRPSISLSSTQQVIPPANAAFSKPTPATCPSKAAPRYSQKQIQYTTTTARRPFLVFKVHRKEESRLCMSSFSTSFIQVFSHPL